MKNNNNIDGLFATILIALFVKGIWSGSIIMAVVLFMAGLIVLSIVRPLVSKYIDKKEQKWYGTRIENIYEYSKYPGDTQVFQRAEYHRHKLQESGNSMNVEVVEIYYKDAGHRHETWQEYEERKLSIIAEDEEKRMLHLSKKEGRSFFRAEVLLQDGVEY